MIRNAFNGGELAPRFRVRADMDVYQRGVRHVENFDIGQEGGLSRRRGFASFAEAQGESSRLFTYLYSNDIRYLVEVGTSYIRVYDVDASILFETASIYYSSGILNLRSLQINSIQLFCCSDAPPYQLSCDSAGNWSFEMFSLEIPPWRYSGYRDLALTISRRTDGYFDIEFDEDEDAEEATPQTGEIIRVSHYTETERISMAQSELFNEIDARYEEGFMDAGTIIAKGYVIAVRQIPEYAVYTCISDWAGGTMFIDGLIDPANYTGNFQISTDSGGYSSTIEELTGSQSYIEGQRVRFAQGYWNIYTCIRAFNGSTDFVATAIDPSDYTGHFIEGVMMGSAPCKGTWLFYSAGLWYGSYEIRASYRGQDVNSDWEYRTEIYSPNASPVNTPAGGDESSEECYISLWFTRARAYGGTWKARNFPADYCGNELVITSYCHDMMLKYQAVIDDNNQVLDGYYINQDTIPIPWYGSITTDYWSWCAFCDKYGFPRLACIYNQRLVFAGTISQPQTIWLSRTDDITNFDDVLLDDGAMALSMSSQSQDPIRWMASQNARIMLGTAEGEYIVQSGSTSSVMTYANASISIHGYNGAANINHLQCNDQVIYFERGAGRAFNYGYDYTSDAYRSTDLSVYADHMLSDGGGAKEGCFLRKPDAKAIIILNDGTIACMTYNSMHQINAWHRYTTDGSFLSCCMLPNGNSEDSLYVITARTCLKETPEGGLADPDDTETRYFIERLDEKSSYYDADERDYTSICISNTLQTTSLGKSKQNKPQLSLYFLDPAEVKGLELSVQAGVDGSWTRPAYRPSSSFSDGWVNFTAPASASDEYCVAFRVSGNRPLKVLALQA